MNNELMEESPTTPTDGKDPARAHVVHVATGIGEPGIERGRPLALKPTGSPPGRARGTCGNRTIGHKGERLEWPAQKRRA